MTTDRKAPMPSLWIFIVADLLLLGVATIAILWTPAPLQAWQVITAAACAAVGAWFSFIPFLKRHEADVKLTEADRLTDTVAQLQNLEEISEQIRAATGQWQGVQEAAGKTTIAAKEIAERMSGEAKAFQEFLKKNNEGEKNNLRLEIDKLRRSEGEWLQLTVRLLDHVFALHGAGVRSGQRGLIEQLTQFQTACRDVARRAGLVAFMARPDETFNGEAHQLADPKAVAAEGDIVEGTVVPGYTFQGQLVRKAVVVLKSTIASATTEEAIVEPAVEEPAAATPETETASEAPEEAVSAVEEVVETVTETTEENAASEPVQTEDELVAELEEEAPAAIAEPEPVEDEVVLEQESETPRGKGTQRPQEPELF